MNILNIMTIQSTIQHNKHFNLLQIHANDSTYKDYELIYNVVY